MRFLLALALCTWMAGCALSPSTTAKAPPLLPGEVRSAKMASDALSIGKSTKADVRAALGQATVIDFESGYEVWLYRERPAEKPKGPSPAAELVLLFAPSGILAKTRLRTGPATSAR